MTKNQLIKRAEDLLKVMSDGGPSLGDFLREEKLYHFYLGRIEHYEKLERMKCNERKS